MPDDWRSDRAYGGQLANHRVEAEIAALADRQHGVVARRQLVALGLGTDAIDGRLARRRLVPLHRGVYAVGHARLRPEGFRLAAVLACGPRAVLSHRSAAGTWGLVGDDARTRVDVTVPSARVAGRTLPRIVVHRAALPADERTERDGIPLTNLRPHAPGPRGHGAAAHAATTPIAALATPRAARLQAAGHVVRRFGWGDVTSGSLVDDLARLLLHEREDQAA